jgi:hypothetical protein
MLALADGIVTWTLQPEILFLRFEMRKLVMAKVYNQ